MSAAVLIALALWLAAVALVVAFARGCRPLPRPPRRSRW